MTLVTVAQMTIREAGRRKVLWALAVLTAVLLGLDAWGFAKLDSAGGVDGQLTTGEGRLVASLLLNLVMYTLSLVVALGTAFLAGPTLSGEVESGVALSVLARPVRRISVLLGKWLGLVVFATVYLAVAGTIQFLIVRITTGYVPPQPVLALLGMAAQAIVLLTLAMLLASALSPMASGVLAVGLFGATWVAGVIGGIGSAVGNAGVERVGTVSRVLLPTDGLWQGVMHALQAPSALAQMGNDAAAFPFLSTLPLSWAYVGWVVLWLLIVLGVTTSAFTRRDI